MARGLWIAIGLAVACMVFGAVIVAVDRSRAQFVDPHSRRMQLLDGSCATSDEPKAEECNSAGSCPAREMHGPYREHSSNPSGNDWISVRGPCAFDSVRHVTFLAH